jgi:hypothetical protein
VRGGEDSVTHRGIPSKRGRVGNPGIAVPAAAGGEKRQWSSPFEAAEGGRENQTEDAETHPLAPARGIVICFLIGVALWAVIIAAWSLFR